MLLNSIKSAVGRYFKGADSLQGQPLPEVNKALIEDAPRVIRLTIWAIIGFFVFLVVWAGFSSIDEVTRGDGKAIPSSKIAENPEPGRRYRLRIVRQGRPDRRGWGAVDSPRRHTVCLQCR